MTIFFALYKDFASLYCVIIYRILYRCLNANYITTNLWLYIDLKIFVIVGLDIKVLGKCWDG